MSMKQFGSHINEEKSIERSDASFPRVNDIPENISTSYNNRQTIHLCITLKDITFDLDASR